MFSVLTFFGNMWFKPHANAGKWKPPSPPLPLISPERCCVPKGILDQWSNDYGKQQLSTPLPSPPATRHGPLPSHRARCRRDRYPFMKTSAKPSPAPSTGGGTEEQGGGKNGDAVGGDSDPGRDATEHLNLRDRLVKAISKTTTATESPANSTNSNPSSASNSRHGLRREWSLDAAGSGTLISVHGATGSGHGSGGGSGHGVNWIGLSGGGSGHGARRAPVVNSSGSRHGMGGSRHGSDAAPLPIPENGEVVGWTQPPGEILERVGASEPGLLGEFGKQVSLALSGAFGSEHGSVASAKTGGGGEGIPPTDPRERLESGTSVGSSLMRGLGGKSGKAGGGDADSSEEGAGAGVEQPTDGFFMRNLDRAVSSVSIGAGSSAHGSGWGGSVSAGGSAHGSVGSIGVGGGGGGGGSGGGGGGGGGGGSSRRASGVLLPWSQQDEQEKELEGKTSRGEGSGASDDLVDGLMRGVERALSAVGAVAGAPDPPSGAGIETPRSMIDLSTHCPSDSRRLSTLSVAESMGGGAGYDAAMADWPAGKVEGNPAWEEWSPEKKLVGHFVTAGCLAVMILTW